MLEDLSFEKPVDKGLRPSTFKPSEVETETANTETWIWFILPYSALLCTIKVNLRCFVCKQGKLQGNKQEKIQNIKQFAKKSNIQAKDQLRQEGFSAI